MATEAERLDPKHWRAANPITIAGAWITTLAVFAFLTYLALEAFGLIASPYAGLFGFILVPLCFVLGPAADPGSASGSRRSVGATDRPPGTGRPSIWLTDGPARSWWPASSV